MKKIYTIALALIASVGFMSCGGSTPAPATSTEGAETATPAETQVAQTAPETPKQWTEVMRLTGSGDKKSAVFTLNGGNARLRYDFKAGEYGGMMAVYVVKEGVDIMQTGGFPEVMVEDSEEGESSLSQLSSGNYYLNVTAANGKWTVIVEEMK